MRQLYLILLFLYFISPLHAQITEPENILREEITDTTEGWQSGFFLSIGATQASFVNWASGGQNSLELSGITNFYANYRLDNISWDNSLDAGYGILRQGKGSEWMKTNDRIDLSSKFGRRASKKWHYSGLLNFKTQMDAGYDYPNDSVKISGFLSPAYIIGAVGMDYKPNRYISAFMAPVTTKITIVNNQKLANTGSFGVEEAFVDENTGEILKPGEKSRSEFGGYVRLAFQKKNILEDVNLTTRLDLFSNYLHNPQNIDVNWEVLITMKVTKYITLALSTQLIYDDDVDIGIDTNNDGTPDKFGPRTQYKQIISLGLSYNIDN